MRNLYESLDTVYSANVSGYAKAVCVYLFRRADKLGRCFPSLTTIAKEVGFSLSTIRRAIEELVSAKLIEKDNRKRKGYEEYTSNEYTVMLPTFTEEASAEGMSQENKPMSDTDRQQAEVCPTGTTKPYHSSSKPYSPKKKNNTRQKLSSVKQAILDKYAIAMGLIKEGEHYIPELS